MPPDLLALPCPDNLVVEISQLKVPSLEGKVTLLTDFSSSPVKGVSGLFLRVAVYHGTVAVCARVSV